MFRFLFGVPFLVLLIGAAALHQRALAPISDVPQHAAPMELATSTELIQLPKTLEVVETAAARGHGLSGRTTLPDDYGMLFVFEEDGEYGFWMKDMLIPIDMIWIANDGTIVHIEHNASPDSYPQSFLPGAPARFVLETRAGYAQEHGWNVGDHFDLGTYSQGI